MDDSDILGTRLLIGPSGTQVEAVIYFPKIDHHGSFYCEFSLNGLVWSGKRRRSYGIDAIQAVYLGLQSIGSDLEAMRQGGEELSWVGESQQGDLGFPTIKTLYTPVG